MRNGKDPAVIPFYGRRKPPKKSNAAAVALSKIIRGVRRWSVQIIALVAVIAIFYFGVTRPTVISKVFTPQVAESVVPRNPLFDRPSTAPNGKPWPAEAGYIAGYPRQNIGGNADVTVSNIGGLNDVFAKLIDTDAKPTTAVRVIFLKVKSEFTMHRVKPGHYDVRYLNLDTGVIRQSPSFDVTVKKTAAGEEFMGWTVPIYEALDGKIFHKEIGKDEF